MAPIFIDQSIHLKKRYIFLLTILAKITYMFSSNQIKQSHLLPGSHFQKWCRARSAGSSSSQLIWIFTGGIPKLNSLPTEFCMLFRHLLFFFFKINFFQKILSGIQSECQTVLIQIRPDILSGLIWVQTVC